MTIPGPMAADGDSRARLSTSFRDITPHSQGRDCCMEHLFRPIDSSELCYKFLSDAITQGDSR